MKATLRSIKRFSTNIKGQPLMTKDGRPYSRVIITIEEQEGNISGFGDKVNASWKVGDKVEVDIVTNGSYLNFNMPKKAFSGVSRQEFDDLVLRVKALEMFKTDEPMPEEPTEDNIPF